MINFICQFGWAMVSSYVDIIILDISVRVFIDDIKI